MLVADSRNNPPSIRKYLLLATWAMALAAALFHWRVELASGLIPIMRVMISLCESRFTATEFDVRVSTSEQLFHLRLTADHPVAVFGHTLPGMDISATTLVTHLLLDLWIFLGVISAGALLTKQRIFRLLPTAIGAFVLLCWVDIPLVLLGSIEGLLAQHLEPAQLNTNPWVLWEQFLTHGGRMVLALALGLLALGACANIPPSAKP